MRLRPLPRLGAEALAGIGLVGTTFGVDVIAALLETTENAERRPGRFLLIGDKELEWKNLKIIKNVIADEKIETFT